MGSSNESQIFHALSKEGDFRGSLSIIFPSQSHTIHIYSIFTYWIYHKNQPNLRNDAAAIVPWYGSHSIGHGKPTTKNGCDTWLFEKAVRLAALSPLRVMSGGMAQLLGWVGRVGSTGSFSLATPGVFSLPIGIIDFGPSQKRGGKKEMCQNGRVFWESPNALEKPPKQSLNSPPFCF